MSSVGPLAYVTLLLGSYVSTPPLSLSPSPLSQPPPPQAIDRLKQEASTEFPDRRVAVEFMPLDLSSFQSTREFAAAFRGRNLPLHVLVNNAGVAWLQQKSESS